MTIAEQIVELQKVTLDEVKAFHKNFYGASKAELAVVGDFDPAAVKQVVTESLAGWKSSVPYTRVTNRHFDIPAARFDLDTPDKENGIYLARVNLDLRDDDPQYPALIVANYLFGEGGLNSRLMDRIRQKEGLSYGTRSGLSVDSLDRASSFSIMAIAAPQNLSRVDAAVKDELARAVGEGFTAEEIARAKSGLLQQRLQTRAQDSALASGWVDFLYLGRTFKWSKELENKITALTVDQVNAAFRQHIDPAKLTVAVAGDAAKIKAASKQ
jgi:zinc protease